MLNLGSTISITNSHLTCYYLLPRILQMFERGIRGRHRGIQMREQSLNCLTVSELDPSQEPLKLLDISTAFVVIIAGLALSFVVWIIEQLGYLIFK